MTVSLDEKITENDEAYEKLISSLINWHNQSPYFYESDYICYNIGSPLLDQYLRSDF